MDEIERMNQEVTSRALLDSASLYAAANEYLAASTDQQTEDIRCQLLAQAAVEDDWFRGRLLEIESIPAESTESRQRKDNLQRFMNEHIASIADSVGLLINAELMAESIAALKR